MSNKTNMSKEQRASRRRGRHSPAARGFAAARVDPRPRADVVPEGRPETPAQAFRKVAQQRVAKTEPDGSIRIVTKPQRSREFDWHTPHVFVPEHQWQASTGITRYAFARDTTPQNQLPLFHRLQRLYQVDGPPVLAPDSFWEPVRKARESGVTLANGLPGEEQSDAFWEELGNYVVREISPDGQWSFTFQAIRMGSEIGDRLDLKHRDYRTVPDWTLLMRFRSWVLPDNRSAFLVMPGIDIHKPGWEREYENDTPNNLQLISTRRYEDEA